MDFIRVGEALLRSSQPILPFLAPSASLPRRIPVPSTHCRQKAQRQHATSRPFTTSPRNRQQQGASSAARKEPEQPTTSSITDEFARLLDSALDSDKGVPTAPTGRTSRFKSPSAQTHNSPSRLVAQRQRQQYNDPPLSSLNPASHNQDKGSLHELLEAIKSPSHTPRQTPSNLTPNLAAALDPQGNVRTRLSPPPPPTPQTAPIKLNSSVGRTIAVDATRGMDVAKAFRSLEVQCARNSVKRDFMRQRFHERPGLRRKRLRSERWRRRFKEGFRGTVRMVLRMRGQGW